MSLTAREIANLIGATVVGDANVSITACAAPESASASELIFVESPKHADAALRSRANCVIAPEGIQLDPKTVLRVKSAKLAFAKAAAILHPQPPIAQRIHATAVVSDRANLATNVAIGAFSVIEAGAEIGANAQIGAHCFIGTDVKLGADCRLHPRVSLYAGTQIGARALIHSGAVIGADGFGLVDDNGKYVKFPQLGTVIIGEDAEIGANTTIDRGALGATTLGDDVKLDNLVHIAHNVQIGSHTAISAQTGIAGSTIIGKNCVIGGQVGMGDHCRLEDGAILGSKCGVLPGKIIKGGIPVWGIPAKPLEKYKEVHFWYDRLPELAERLHKLEQMSPEDSRNSR
jgi:UDP-3-O-[3-hydroxymyristoyl] glucosamine N-acyltransferase